MLEKLFAGRRRDTIGPETEITMYRIMPNPINEKEGGVSYPLASIVKLLPLTEADTIAWWRDFKRSDQQRRLELALEAANLITIMTHFIICEMLKQKDFEKQEPSYFQYPPGFKLSNRTYPKKVEKAYQQVLDKYNQIIASDNNTLMLKGSLLAPATDYLLKKRGLLGHHLILYAAYWKFLYMIEIIALEYTMEKHKLDETQGLPVDAETRAQHKIWHEHIAALRGRLRECRAVFIHY
jgi:hypothetical protein